MKEIFRSQNEPLPCDNSVLQGQEESFGDSADLNLKFKAAEESSGPKLKGFCGSSG